MWTTGSAAAECRADVILCSDVEWCRKFVQRAALPISLADRNWLSNLPRQIALYAIREGMDNFLGFCAPVDLPEALGYLSKTLDINATSHT